MMLLKSSTTILFAFTAILLLGCGDDSELRSARSAEARADEASALLRQDIADLKIQIEELVKKNEANNKKNERLVQANKKIRQENTRLAKQLEDAKREAPVAARVIPADVWYAIIKSDIMPGIKRSLDVRINKKVSKDTLRAIALKLKAQDSRSHERTFICYVLPGMEVGSGAWATTHFNPNLEVRILGLTAEQEEALKRQPDDRSEQVIGSWLDETPFIGGRITIFRQKAKLFMERTFKDGSSIKKKIVTKASTSGKKFEDKEENGFGEYYWIDERGNLQFWDQDGWISTAKRIGGYP